MSAVERVVLPPCVTPTHYDIELTPDIAKLEFVGSEAIKVVVNTNTKEIRLHSKEIQVTEANFKSEDGSVILALNEVTKLLYLLNVTN